MNYDKNVSCFGDEIRNSKVEVRFLIFTPDHGDVLKCPPHLLWSSDKEAQVIESSALVV